MYGKRDGSAWDHWHCGMRLGQASTILVVGGQRWRVWNSICVCNRFFCQWWLVATLLAIPRKRAASGRLGEPCGGWASFCGGWESGRDSPSEPSSAGAAASQLSVAGCGTRLVFVDRLRKTAPCREQTSGEERVLAD
jgi:hypothetical protein